MEYLLWVLYPVTVQTEKSGKIAPALSARMRPFTQPLYACLKRNTFQGEK
jgi:hypothetical protein